MRTKLPIPEPQGTTPMERLDWAFRTVLKVPKAAMVKTEQHPSNLEGKRAKKAKS